MGRKADPRGKDRPRTIVLSGDVAEIAQKLADKGDLSSTLSDLLRQSYGFGAAVDEMKRQLSHYNDEKEDLSRRIDDLAQQIEQAEDNLIQQNTTLRPSLEKRRALLVERNKKLHRKLQRAFTPHEESKLHLQISNINEMIVEVDLELEALK